MKEQSTMKSNSGRLGVVFFVPLGGFYLFYLANDYNN